MGKCPRLDLTREMAAQIRAVEQAIRIHVIGRESCDAVDLPKLKLADIVLDLARKRQLLPRKGKAVKVVSLVTKKRRRA